MLKDLIAAKLFQNEAEKYADKDSTTRRSIAIPNSSARTVTSPPISSKTRSPRVE